MSPQRERIAQRDANGSARALACPETSNDFASLLSSPHTKRAGMPPLTPVTLAAAELSKMDGQSRGETTAHVGAMSVSRAYDGFRKSVLMGLFGSRQTRIQSLQTLFVREILIECGESSLDVGTGPHFVGGFLFW